MEDYRVNLDVYNGPLDLLLYLIRREEVDIYDIPIAQITEQYVRYVEYIKAVDPDLAGEFLVLAATLLEIKTRMLLPAPEMAEGAEGLEVDPRAELVRQLLEYKAFKDAAGDLEDAAAEQALRYARRPPRGEADEEGEIDLEDVQIWDLFDAFSKLMEAIGHRPTHHEVIYDDTPVELHAADILDRLGREGGMTFDRVFEGRSERGQIVGLFLAILELVRQRRIVARQKGNFGTLWLRLNPRAPGPEAAAGREESPAAAEEAGAPEAEADAGTYVAEPRHARGDAGRPAESDDDAGAESEGTGD